MKKYLIHNEDIQDNVVLMDMNVGLGINGITETRQLGDLAQLGRAEVGRALLLRRAERLAEAELEDVAGRREVIRLGELREFDGGVGVGRRRSQGLFLAGDGGIQEGLSSTLRLYHFVQRVSVGIAMFLS